MEEKPRDDLKQYLIWLKQKGATRENESNVSRGDLIKRIVDAEGIPVAEACKRMSALREAGYVEYDPPGEGYHVWLTQKGQSTAKEPSTPRTEKRVKVTKQQEDRAKKKARKELAPTHQKITKKQKNLEAHELDTTQADRTKEMENHASAKEEGGEKGSTPPYDGFKKHLLWLRRHKSGVGVRRFCKFISEQENVTFPKAWNWRGRLLKRGFLHQEQTSQGTKVWVTDKGKREIEEE